MRQKDGRLTTVILHLKDGSAHTYWIAEGSHTESVSIAFKSNAGSMRRYPIIASGLTWPAATQYILAIQDIYLSAPDHAGYGQQDDKTALPVEWMDA